MSENIKNKIKRPRGRPPMDRAIYQYVIGEARAIRNKSILPEALAKHLVKDIDEWDKISPTPTWQTIKKKIEEARRYPNELDEPWSIGASVQRNDIPPEYNELLFDVWRYSLALDRPISIRQARWIVNIKSLSEASSKHCYEEIIKWPPGAIMHDDGTTGEYPKQRNPKVIFMLSLIEESWWYCIREMAHEMSVDKISAAYNLLDTSDIDSFFMASWWERFVALDYRKFPGIRYEEAEETLIKLKGIKEYDLIGQTTSIVMAVWRMVNNNKIFRYDKFLVWLNKILPEEQDLVASHYLNYLSKGPLWNNVNQEEMCAKLLEWVESCTEEYYHNSSITIPPEILLKVGYPVSDEYKGKWVEWLKKCQVDENNEEIPKKKHKQSNKREGKK
jgi:hypothetical protein